MDRKKDCQTLMAERLVNWFLRKIKIYRVPLLASVIVGALCYMFAFTNKLVNHDDVAALFSKGITASSGRWGLDLLSYILPDCSLPWFHGVITIILVAVSICAMVNIYSIHNKLLQALLAGSVIAFPSLIGTFSYMFTSSSYGISFFLSVFAVYLLKSQPKKLFLPALVCMVLSLGIYQAYVAITASFLVLILIQRILYEEDVRSVIRVGILYVAFLLLSLVFYYGVTQLILTYSGSQFNSYAMGAMKFDCASILKGIKLAYLNICYFFVYHLHVLNLTKFSIAVHRICAVATFLLLFVWELAQNKHSVSRFFLLLALITVLPLAINCMYLLVDADAVHALVLYSYIAIYILAVIIAQACLPLLLHRRSFEFIRRIAINVIALGMVAAVLNNIYIANKNFFRLYLRYENAYCFYTSLVASLHTMPEFDESTSIAVIGQYEDPEFYKYQFDNEVLTGFNGFTPNQYSKQFFLEYYLGISVPFASQAECDKIASSQEYSEMAVYPYYGSIKMIGDVLVVKLS